MAYYRSEDDNDNDETLPVRVESETHLGIAKKTGAWLEDEVEKILKFAGFETIREKTEIYDESTRDHYRVDVVAKLDKLTLFVECKDYTDVTVSPKILFTLIGQVHDYRRSHPDEHVIGILATTAKNVGQNQGTFTKLQKEGCFLWDGLMIQQLQNKMMEFHTKSEFTSYVLREIEYIQSINDEIEQETLPKYTREELLPNEHLFDCIMEFYSINKSKYVGNDFSYLAIEMDIKKSIKNSKIKFNSFEYEVIDEDTDPYIHCFVDFEMKRSSDEINRHWKSKCKLWKKPEQDALKLMELHFVEACRLIVEKTYGVNLAHAFVPSSIRCVGIRVE